MTDDFEAALLAAIDATPCKSISLLRGGDTFCDQCSCLRLEIAAAMVGQGAGWRHTLRAIYEAGREQGRREAGDEG